MPTMRIIPSFNIREDSQARFLMRTEGSAIDQWTSGYSYGMWGPIRESCYQTCGNPLHRLHRYPERQILQDTVDDAAILVDEIIQHLDETYPTFEWRLLKKAETEQGGDRIP